jgi:polysaccharide deacetylase family protein (PEP-CTERM system associated)
MSDPQVVSSLTTNPESLQPPCVRVFSVDVEDYFHAHALADVAPRESWSAYECRVEANTKRIFEILARHHTRATFFFLGWVAERFGSLVREAVALGHEIGCHSYWHRLIYNLSPRQFRSDTLLAKDVLEQAAGIRVFGYRAPSYSITSKSLWAFEILVELGFTYDSSIFPIRHDVYGVPGAPRRPFSVPTRCGRITEYPMTTFRCGGMTLPVGGGAYLRILPPSYTRLGIQIAERECIPLIVYVHPWEIDAKQPVFRTSWLSHFRHYTNVSRTSGRIEAILSLGHFGNFQDLRRASSPKSLSMAG